MNSNIFLNKLNNLIISVKNEKEAQELLFGLFTQNEIETLKKRWRILEMLNQGATQRQIAQDLNVSLCKVTRGAKVLKEKSILTEFLTKEGNNE
ncbi:MAG: helix-turn-helix domain-containing protein [Candidatus Gastranaerophilales bacterium]|nr:helix-turn-helix domain-containing protein [Candidatus Gastranaerophilales bacterium]